MTHIAATQLFRWETIPKERLNDLLERRMITGEHIMLTHLYMKKGAIVPMHQHKNEQLSYLVEGKIKFWVESEENPPITVQKGEVLHLPSNVPHGVEAVEDSLAIDIFSPPRQDWLDGTDDYLRK